MEQPLDTAEALLRHSSFKAIEQRRDYQRWARSVGWEALTDDEMRQMRRATGDLVAERPYWVSDYGWAHEALLEGAPDYAKSSRVGAHGVHRSPTSRRLPGSSH